MTPSVGIAITCFHNPLRLRKILLTLDELGHLDTISRGVPVRVFQDPWDKYSYDDRAYERLCLQFGVLYMRLPKWSCMQGSAQFAVEHTPEDWFLYLPDDVLPSLNSITDMLDWVKRLHDAPVGAIQWPYWNADELPNAPWDHKDEMWTLPSTWLYHVPRNDHWDRFGRPYPYVNLNGAGFALRRSTWAAVGGFSQETWCLDEDMGAKIWLRTDQMVVAVPGAPIVHYMGGALEHPEHDFWTAHAWTRAGWPPKDDLFAHGGLVREAMRARTGIINDGDPCALLEAYKVAA